MTETPASSSFDQAVADHDRRVRESGLVVWVGAEPTFTNRTSFDPAWTTEAIGSDEKEAQARSLVARAATLRPGTLVLRTVGRQYPGEPLPRWSYGTYRYRDDRALWPGPPDPLLAQAGSEVEPSPHASPYEEAAASQASEAAFRLRRAMAERLANAGFAVECFDLDMALGVRLAFSESAVVPASPEQDTRLARASLHSVVTAPAGLLDDLADSGVSLLCFGTHADVDPDCADVHHVRVELPLVGTVDRFTSLLSHLADAADDAEVTSLVIGGFPPPVDDTVSFETITPDPGVIEVNMAPSPDAVSFLAACRTIYGNAEAHGLSSYRIYFNGDITDSGGGGHITLGGRVPAESPFFAVPQLLPRWIAYVMRHPALSYWFARDGAGSSSQSPRADETTPESYEELALAIELLVRRVAPRPEELWESLAPFMTDRFGNTHRAEINVEKLWNPHLSGRGQLGLVELRALGMARTPEHITARAVLFRSLLAMLARTGAEPELVRWGSDLHDRYALPFYLRLDLHAVLDELADAGFELAEPVAELLLTDREYLVGRVEFAGLALEVRRAVEFWPLVGDLTAQSGTSRLVDASAERLEVVLRPRDGDAERLAGWRLCVRGYELPVVRDVDRSGPALVLGLRYRRFVPSPGLHPLLRGHGVLEFTCFNDDRDEAWTTTTYPWKPDGGAYAGVPPNPEDAARRRRDRFRVERTNCPRHVARPRRGMMTPHCFDTRWLQTS